MAKKDETKAARRDRRAAEAVSAYAEAARLQAEAAARAARVAEAVAADLEARREQSAAAIAIPVQPIPAAAPHAAPTEAMLAGAGQGGRVGLSLRSVIERMQGTSMCFGEPLEYEGRTVVPVARVSARGGLGFGGDQVGGGGGGGGGRLEGTPVGFLEIDAGGSRFVAIPDATAPARAIRSAGMAAGALVVSLAASRRLLRGPRRALPRGRL